MGDIIKKSNLINLRLTQEKDLDFIIDAENDSKNNQYIGNWSRYKHLKSFSDSDILHLVIKDSRTNKFIGYLIMAGIENPNHSIEFKRLVICE